MATPELVSLSASARLYEGRILVSYVMKVGSAPVLMNYLHLTARKPPTTLIVTGIGEALLLLATPPPLESRKAAIRLEPGATYRGKVRLASPLAESGFLANRPSNDPPPPPAWVPVREFVVGVEFWRLPPSPKATAPIDGARVEYATSRVKLKDAVVVPCSLLGVALAEPAIATIFGDAAKTLAARQFAIAAAPRDVAPPEPVADDEDWAETQERRALSPAEIAKARETFGLPELDSQRDANTTEERDTKPMERIQMPQADLESAPTRMISKVTPPDRKP